jgi:EmrB/QacA subfamily drug resistance transporter
VPQTDGPIALRTLDSPGGRWIIAATVLGSGMAAIDATVVGIALPTIGREFHSTFGELQWIVTGYALSLAALLLLGGWLGDRYGRRLIFSIGVVWFVVASAACALAPDVTILIVTRVLQGVGAALLTPGSLAIIESSFRDEDRGSAIGTWSGLGGVATAAGPLLGGYLVAAASWRWIFLINLPVGAVVLAVSVRHVPESRNPELTGRPDLGGAALAVLALGGITFGLIEGPSFGWSSPIVVTMVVLGISAGIAFVLVERARANPMLPLTMFRTTQFSAANAVTFVVYGALGATLFLLPIDLQVVAGYSPLESGLALLPLTVIMLTLSARSGRLAHRIGPRIPMSIGPCVVGVGMALLTRSPNTSSYLVGVFPGVVVLGLGLALTVAPLTTTALGSVSDSHSGVASAVNNCVARLGGLIAVAAIPAIAGITRASYLRPSQFASGFRHAGLMAGALSVLAGILSALFIRNPIPQLDPALHADEQVPPVLCTTCAIDAAPLVAGVQFDSATDHGPHTS